MELTQESLVLLTDMLYRTSVKEDEVEDLSALADVFVPLGQPTTRRLRLHRQVFEEAQKAAIFDVCRLCLHQAFDLFEVVEDFVRLLHIVLIAGLEDATLPLLVVEKAKLDLDVHWVLKLFDPLLHRAKVAREVILRLLLHEGENYRQLVEEVVDGVQDWMQGEVGIR